MRVQNKWEKKGSFFSKNIKKSTYEADIGAFFRARFPQHQAAYIENQSKDTGISLQVLYPCAIEPFYIIHTIGMNHPSMVTKGQHQDIGGAELWLMVTVSWPFSKFPIKLDDTAAWPLRLLLCLAEFFHRYQVKVTNGWVLSQGEVAVPFLKQMPLSGVIMSQLSGELAAYTMQDGRKVELFMPILVYQEELSLLSDISTDDLVESVIACNNDSFQLQRQRPNVADMEFILI